MKIVAFVPIRLNSKRVAGKNLRLLNGKPMMNYLFETLLTVANVDEVYCFCSQENIRENLPERVRFLKRDESLDSDSTLGCDIYSSFVSLVDADLYVLAHATSPFIRKETIENALNNVINNGYDSAFSAEKIQTFTWYKGSPLNYSLKEIPRTQDIEPIYVETSAFYMFKKEVWTRSLQRIGNRPYMAIVDKVEGVDIDWPEDFEFAEILSRYNNEQS